MYSSVTLGHFMRISNDVTVPLGPVTILVGENGAGKSSILKGIHWAIRCAHLRDSADRMTLERMDYAPSRDFLHLGHKTRLNSESTSPQVHVKLTSGADSLDIELKSTRNDAGIKVTVSGTLAHTISSHQQITAYIPGLAGLSEAESLLATPVLNRRAASGEGGSVLRHVLLHLATVAAGKDSLETHAELHELSKWVGKVFEGVRFWVKFDRIRDVYIDAKFPTKDMIESGKRLELQWKSLEMAGTGFLQVVQIFAYLLHFKPKLLLIDEPDSHLHPGTQELLIKAIEKAAIAFPETQFVITTHSPSLIKAAGAISRVLWISDGAVRTENQEISRKRMGWGALDKDLMLITEDGKLSYMKAILDQWPELARKVLLWPAFGSGSLPTGSVLSRLRKELGIPVIVHRDRDFMSNTDKANFELKREYSTCSVPLWMPSGSDIESGICAPENIEAAFEPPKGDGQNLLAEAIALLDPIEVETDFNTAYQAAIAGLEKNPGSAPSIRWRELGGFCTGTTKGKTLLESVMTAAKSRYEGTAESRKLRGLGTISTALAPMHEDLKAIIEAEIARSR
jgi:predicted ATPase